MMHRKSDFRPFGAVKGWGLLPRTEAQPLAMLTTPASFCFGSDGNFLPVLGIALAVDGHGRSLLLGVGSSFRGLYPVLGVVGTGG